MLSSLIERLVSKLDDVLTEFKTLHDRLDSIEDRLASIEAQGNVAPLTQPLLPYAPHPDNVPPPHPYAPAVPYSPYYPVNPWGTSQTSDRIIWGGGETTDLTAE